MADPSVQDLIASLRAEGQLAAQGEFGLDAQQARAKLQQFQLEDPHHYILEWVQAAHLLGATRISIRQDANELWFWCDGQALSALELEELYAAAFRRRANQRDLAMRRLALGMSAAQALQPALVELVSQAPNTQAVRLVQRAGKPDQVGPVNHKRPGLSLYVAERARLRHALEFLRTLGGELEESAVVRARCAPSRCEITLNGKRISRGFALPHAVDARVALDHPMARGLIGLSRQTQHTAGHLDLMQHGVVIMRFALPPAPWAVCGELEVPTLSTDLSQRRFIEDDAWRALWVEAIEPALYEAALSLVRQDGRSAWSVEVARHVVYEVCRYRRAATPLSLALIQLACALEFAPLWAVADAPDTLLSARDLGVSLQNDARLCVSRERIPSSTSLTLATRPALLPDADALVTYLARPVEDVTARALVAKRREANLARLDEAPRWLPVRGAIASERRAPPYRVELVCRLHASAPSKIHKLNPDLILDERLSHHALRIYIPARDGHLRLLDAQPTSAHAPDLSAVVSGPLPLLPDASGVDLDALDDAFWELVIDAIHALMVARVSAPAAIDGAHQERLALASRWLSALLDAREVVWAMRALGMAPGRADARAAQLLTQRPPERQLQTRAASRDALIGWLGPLASAPLLPSVAGAVSLETLWPDTPAPLLWHALTARAREESLALIDALHALGERPDRPVVMEQTSPPGLWRLIAAHFKLLNAVPALRAQLNRANFLAKPQTPPALELARGEALITVCEPGLQLALLPPTSSAGLSTGSIIASVRYQGRELELLDAPLALGECVAVFEAPPQLTPAPDWTTVFTTPQARDAACATLTDAAWRAWQALASAFDAPSASPSARALVLGALALGAPTIPAPILAALAALPCIAARIGAETRWLTRAEAGALEVRGALSESLLDHVPASAEAALLVPDHPGALDALRGALARPELRSLDSTVQRAATMSAKRQAFFDASVLALEPPPEALHVHAVSARASSGVLAILPDPHPTRTGGTLTVELLREGRLVSTQTLGCVMGHLWARCETPRVFHMGSLALRQEPLAETHQALLDQVRPALIGWCQALNHPLDDLTRQLILHYLQKLRVVRREDEALRRALGAVPLFDTPQDNSPLSFDGLLSRAPGLHDAILCVEQGRPRPDVTQEPRPIIVIDAPSRALLQPLLGERTLVSLEEAPALERASPLEQDALWRGQLEGVRYSPTLAVLPEAASQEGAPAHLIIHLFVREVLVAVTTVNVPVGAVVAHLALDPPPGWRPGAALDLDTRRLANDAARRRWSDAMLAAINHHRDAPSPQARQSMLCWINALAGRPLSQEAARVYDALMDAPLFEVASAPPDQGALPLVSAAKLLTWPWPEGHVLRVSPHAPAPTDVPALRLDDASASALRAVLPPSRALTQVTHWRLTRERAAQERLTQERDAQARDAQAASLRAAQLERDARRAADSNAQRAPSVSRGDQRALMRAETRAALARQAIEHAEQSTRQACLDAVRAPLRAARLSGVSRTFTVLPHNTPLARIDDNARMVVAEAHPAWRHLVARGTEDSFAAAFVASAICIAEGASPQAREAALSALIVEVVRQEQRS